MKSSKLIAVLSISLLLAASYAAVQTARAQESGDTIVFLIPHLTPISTGAEGDVITYVAQSGGTVDVTGCTADGQLRPSQSVVFVDRGAGEAPTRLTGLITLTVNGEPRTTDMPNGTRLSNMTAPTQCTIGDQTYDKYSSTVD